MAEKYSSITWFAEQDNKATMDFLAGKMTQLQFAMKKTEILHEAIANHKEEIWRAYTSGFGNGKSSEKHGFDQYEPEQYYKDIYK